MQNSPAKAASATASPAYDACGCAAASAPADAAIIAQVAASGPTISCRDVPNRAYATSGRIDA